MIAFERILTRATGNHPPLSPAEVDQRLSMSVVFTSLDPTRAALRQAGALAHSLDARITLLVPQVVPYSLPLETPPVLIEFSEKRLRAIASQSPVETTVKIYWCRDSLGTLNQILRRDSVVIIGAKKRWWPGPEKRLARHLRRSGHQVLLTETE